MKCMMMMKMMPSAFTKYGSASYVGGTMTTESNENRAITLSHMNFYGHVNISGWIITTACCLVVGLGLGFTTRLSVWPVSGDILAFGCHCSLPSVYIPF